MSLGLRRSLGSILPRLKYDTRIGYFLTEDRVKDLEDKSGVSRAEKPFFAKIFAPFSIWKLCWSVGWIFLAMLHRIPN